MNNNCTTTELKAIIRHWPIWFLLGSQDIKLRYRRSSIGPFWITISMAITIYTMSFLYAHLFKVNFETYFPYLATGIIGWSYLSALILEGSNAFIEAENYIRNQDSYLSLFMMRLLLRNSIVLMHNMLVYIPIIVLFHIPVTWKVLLLIPGLLIIGINALCWGTLFAIIGTRYRDFTQIITSLIQIIFFVTPIMWLPSLLPPKYLWVVEYNPFNQVLNLIRAPMMNQVISIENLLLVSLVTAVGFFLYCVTLQKYKHQIVFWL